MLVQKGTKKYIDMLEGVRRRTLAVGEKGLMSEFLLAEGAILPLHSHPHEQIGYLQSGEIILVIGEKEHLVQSGDSWAIQGNVPHAVRVIKEAVVVEVFVPVREDFLD